MIRFGLVLAVTCCAALLGGCDSKERPKVEDQRLRVGHAGNVLTESIGLETLGGVFSPLVKKGTEIPVTIKEVFSTAADNQPGVDIHVLAGNGETAMDNRTIGRFQVCGIPPAPKAVPQIEVCFTIDREGDLTVSARDLGTGKENEIRILGVKTKARE